MGFKTVKKDTIVYKQVQEVVSKGLKREYKIYILEMLLPEGATYYRGRGATKCRADRVVPLSFYLKDGKDYEYVPDKKTINHRGKYSHKKKYTIGKLNKPDYFSLVECQCAGGIHFFFGISGAMRY